MHVSILIISINGVSDILLTVLIETSNNMGLNHKEIIYFTEP